MAKHSSWSFLELNFLCTSFYRYNRIEHMDQPNNRVYGSFLYLQAIRARRLKSRKRQWSRLPNLFSWAWLIFEALHFRSWKQTDGTPFSYKQLNNAEEEIREWEKFQCQSYMRRLIRPDRYKSTSKELWFSWIRQFLSNVYWELRLRIPSSLNQDFNSKNTFIASNLHLGST